MVSRSYPAAVAEENLGDKTKVTAGNRNHDTGINGGAESGRGGGNSFTPGGNRIRPSRRGYGSVNDADSFTVRLIDDGLEQLARCPQISDGMQATSALGEELDQVKPLYWSACAALMPCNRRYPLNMNVLRGSEMWQ